MSQTVIFNKKIVIVQVLLLLCSFFTISAQINRKPTKKNSEKKKPEVVEESSNVLTASEIASNVLPSTVMIITKDENGETVAQGSGFLYKNEPVLDLTQKIPINYTVRFIATNLHVFNRATQAYVKFVGEDKLYKVDEVVGLSPQRDLCIVKIITIETKKDSIPISKKYTIGDDIFVASNPKGLEGSFSKGIVSAVRQNVGLIQIDAAISPGSSGGAVLNNRGEVIGIVVSSLITGQNLNFAIPIKYLLSLKLEFNEPVSTAGAFAFNRRQQEKLNGFVESVIETNADFEYSRNTDSFIEQPAIIDSKMFFDIYGNLISITLYFKGQYNSKYEFSYDNEGFLRRRINDYDGTPLGNNKKFRTVTEYSVLESIKLAGNFRKFSNNSNDGILNETYDSQGNLLESIVYAPNSKREMSKVAYLYGKNGYVSEEKIYSWSMLRSTERFTYQTDEQGNWIKRVSITLYSKYSDLGFIPDSVTYRKINYFSE